MTMTRSRPRRAPWNAPGYGDLYRRRADGTIWTVRRVITQDRQIRLERQGERPVWAFDSQIAAEWDRLSV